MNIFKRLFSCGDHARVICLLEKIMGKLQDLEAAIDAAAATATEEKAEVATAIGALTDEIAALKAQVAAGQAVSDADLDRLIGKVSGIGTLVEDITVPAVVPTGGGGPGDDDTPPPPPPGP